jgi:hypothetical protein
MLYADPERLETLLPRFSSLPVPDKDGFFPENIARYEAAVREADRAEREAGERRLFQKNIHPCRTGSGKSELD